MSGVRKSRRDPRNDFLQNSANLLRKNAPATSAFLSSERIALIHEQETPVSDYQKSQVCTACGCLKANPRDSQDLSESAHKDEEAYSCDKCNRKTQLNHPNIDKPSKGQSAEQVVLISSPGIDAVAGQLQGDQSVKPEASSATNTPSSSHKRAKARKQNTLQALLAKSKKTQETKDSGLDFMDFMKAA